MDKKKLRVVLPIVALAVVLVGGVFAYRALSAQQNAKPQETSSASAQDAQLLTDHDATVYTALGEPIRLTDIAAGRPLVVNFWATWCPYCIQELPDFQSIYNDYKDKVSFAFVDVSDGKRETVEGAKAWLDSHNMSDLPAYFDNDLEATTSFGAYSLPTTVVVSAEGEILTITPGVIDATLMREALDSQVGP